MFFFYGEQATTLGDGSSEQTAPPHARELASLGYPSGVYWIKPEGQVAKQTYVDMSNDDGSGGGWVKIHSAWTGGSGQERTTTGANENFLQSSTYSFQEAVMPLSWMNASSWESWRVINEQVGERKIRLYWAKTDEGLNNPNINMYTTQEFITVPSPSEVKGTYKWGTGPDSWLSDNFGTWAGAGHSLCLGTWENGTWANGGSHYPGAGNFHICIQRWGYGYPEIGMWFNYFPWPAYDDSGLISVDGGTFNATGWVR